MLSPQIQIFSKHQFPTLDTSTTPENKGIRLSYGLGWGLFWSPFGKAFFKEGHDEGFRHYTVVFDKPKDGIVIMTNSSNGEGIFKDLLESLLGNTFTPIAWEGFTPYNELPPRKPLPTHSEIAPGSEVARPAGWPVCTSGRGPEDHASGRTFASSGERGSTGSTISRSGASFLQQDLRRCRHL